MRRKNVVDFPTLIFALVIKIWRGTFLTANIIHQPTPRLPTTIHPIHPLSYSSNVHVVCGGGGGVTVGCHLTRSVSHECSGHSFHPYIMSIVLLLLPKARSRTPPSGERERKDLYQIGIFPPFSISLLLACTDNNGCVWKLSFCQFLPD